jgi:HD-GYP domain-containing protein (c-di-GMP phosphodiesterase class II)
VKARPSNGSIEAGICLLLVMTKSLKLGFLVVFLLLSTCAVMSWSYQPSAATPSLETLLAFTVVAFLLEQSSTKLSAGGLGSTSFVIHIAAGLIFGAFWGAIITGSATVFYLMSLERSPMRVTFNASQRILSISLGVQVYSAIGGVTPPVSLQETLFPFFLLSSTYFLVNSVSVSAAISIRTERPFREVWSLNSRGVFGYDIAASSIALLLAWVYKDWGLVGLFIAVLPTLVVRHVYIMYRNLQESSRELLEVMVKSIEARDPYTSGHSLRVRMLSRAIALELGLSIKQLEEIETAALLHDVGKIHEEFAPLLRKETRLTAEETALMQTHAEKSAELVGIVSKFRGAIQESVRHHHERWDGQGYPSGLAGQDIPLGSRIILIADTIDAMTTDRPYRKRLELDVVIMELQKCKGTQFDPKLVDVGTSSLTVRNLIAGATQDTLNADLSPVSSKKITLLRKGIWKAGNE